MAEPKRYLVNGTPIEVRDKGGRLFAKIAPDRKRLFIRQKHSSVELMVDDDGRIIQIKI